MIILDTRSLLYWVNGQPALSDAAMQAIENEQATGTIAISSISAFEMASLESEGRLVLSVPVHEWFAMAARIDAVKFWPVDEQIAIESTCLPGEFRGDLAEKIIVATARHLAVPVITQNPKLRGYAYVKTIW